MPSQSVTKDLRRKSMKIIRTNPKHKIIFVYRSSTLERNVKWFAVSSSSSSSLFKCLCVKLIGLAVVKYCYIVCLHFTWGDLGICMQATEKSYKFIWFFSNYLNCEWREREKKLLTTCTESINRNMLKKSKNIKLKRCRKGFTHHLVKIMIFYVFVEPHCKNARRGWRK